MLVSANNCSFTLEEKVELVRAGLSMVLLPVMDLIHRKNEVILMAPTGAAADNIGGNTLHTAGLTKARKNTVPSHVRNLWARKTIMVIDEVSMVDLSMLSTINNQCKIARSMDRSSPDL